MQTISIAVVNHKGGVGKTTISANLSHALALQGRKVLLVDMDPQCNATMLMMPEDSYPTKENSMYAVMREPDILPQATIWQSKYTGLDTLPNIEETAWLERELYMLTHYDLSMLLRDRLFDVVDGHYDYVIYDCPPNMGLFVLMAMTASNFVCVPMSAGSSFSIQGLNKAVQTISQIRKSTTSDLSFLRLVINRGDRRQVATRELTKLMYDRLGRNKIYETVIPSRKAVFERAERERQTILRYSPRSVLAAAFRALAKETDIIVGKTGA